MIPFITRKVLFPFPSSFSTSVRVDYKITRELYNNCSDSSFYMTTERIEKFKTHLARTS